MSQIEPKTNIHQKLEQLDDAVEWFYGEDFQIDEALAKYRSARKLAAEIDHDLEQLKNQVEVITDLTQ